MPVEKPTAGAQTGRMTEQDPSPLQALTSIWDLAGGDPAALAGVTLHGEDPV